MVRSLLPKYHKILKNQETAQFLVCTHVPVSFEATQTTDELWKIHDKSITTKKLQNIRPKLSLLDLKIELSNRLFQECCFCEHHCKVDRRKTTGKCGVKESLIASEFLHFAEEDMLVPSYTIFFSGCTFHCVFCQNWDISQFSAGITIEPQQLASAIEQRKKQDARNVNWVGGDPTSNLLYILKVLNHLECNIAQVWNSNMYCSEETMKLLHGVVDLYLTDFKYGNDTCAKRLSKVNGYTSVIKRNHLLAYQQGEVIIRHLVLPNHSICCSQKILQWIQKNIPQVMINVMAQYRPEYQANEYKEIACLLSKEEYQKVKEFAKSLDLFLLS